MGRILTNPNPEYCESPLSFDTITLIIIICAVLGLLWAGYNFIMVRRIDIEAEVEDEGEEGQQSDDLSAEKKRILLELSYKISDVCALLVRDACSLSSWSMAFALPCWLLSSCWFGS